MKKGTLTLVGLFFLAGLFTLGLAVSSEAVEPIVIGSINPLTGHSAVQGLDMKRGEEMGLDEIMGLSLAEFAIKEGCETFASFTVNNPFGIGIEIWSEKGVKKHGKQWLTAVRYDERKTDYRAELERLFAKKPEAVFFTAYGTESKLILKQAYEMGLKPTKGWYADHMSMWTNEVIPETANGIKGLNPGPTSGARLEEYKAEFDKRYGKDAPRTVYGWYSYDATWLAALALGLAGTDNPDRIAKALHLVSKYYHGVIGDKTFDKDGMQQMDYYQKFIFKDGKLLPYGW